MIPLARLRQEEKTRGINEVRFCRGGSRTAQRQEIGLIRIRSALGGSRTAPTAHDRLDESYSPLNFSLEYVS